MTFPFLGNWDLLQVRVPLYRPEEWSRKKYPQSPLSVEEAEKIKRVKTFFVFTFFRSHFILLFLVKSPPASLMKNRAIQGAHTLFHYGILLARVEHIFPFSLWSSNPREIILSTLHKSPTSNFSPILTCLSRLTAVTLSECCCLLRIPKLQKTQANIRKLTTREPWKPFADAPEVSCG